MEKVYGRTSLFFIAILLVVIWGFYKTYFVFFPSFEGFQSVQHFHGIMMMLWLVMLILQPLLIVFGKVQVHRAIGKISFVLAPLLIVSIFLMARLSYFTTLKQNAPESEALAFMSLNIPAILAFALLYFLAITNRNDTPSHMRYMIGTSLLMIGPGLARALITYFNVPFPVAGTIVFALATALAAIFLGADILRKKNIRPNTIVLVTLVIYQLCYEFRDSAIWQGIAEVVAKTF